MMVPVDKYNSGVLYQLYLQEQAFWRFIYGLSAVCVGASLGLHTLISRLRQRHIVEGGVLEDLERELYEGGGLTGAAERRAAEGLTGERLEDDATKGDATNKGGGRTPRNPGFLGGKFQMKGGGGEGKFSDDKNSDGGGKRKSKFKKGGPSFFEGWAKAKTQGKGDDGSPRKSGYQRPSDGAKSGSPRKKSGYPEYYPRPSDGAKSDGKTFGRKSSRASENKGSPRGKPSLADPFNLSPRRTEGGQKGSPKGKDAAFFKGKGKMV